MDSLTKMVKLTTALINGLLNPLGMKLYTYKYMHKISNRKNDGSTRIISDNDDNGYAVIHVYDNGFTRSTITFEIGQDALKCMLDFMMQAKYWIKKDGKHLDNPYYNCRSLEEMLIKKDLIA